MSKKAGCLDCELEVRQTERDQRKRKRDIHEAKPSVRPHADLTVSLLQRDVEECVAFLPRPQWPANVNHSDRKDPERPWNAVCSDRACVCVCVCV